MMWHLFIMKGARNIPTLSALVANNASTRSPAANYIFQKPNAFGLLYADVFR